MGGYLAPFFIYLSALLLGIRHGIDWDHIAAIADITSSSANRKEGLTLGTFYAVGHAFVVVVLGLLAILLGLILPSWVDRYTQPFVGLTLIALSVWVVFSVVHHWRTGEELRPKSRWMILFSLFNKIHHSIHSKWDRSYVKQVNQAHKYNLVGAFSIGMIHGIGAETPSQVVLLATAAGVSGRLAGGLYLLSFVLGLLIANSVIVVLSIFGYDRITDHPRILAVVGLVTAFFSFVVGLIFLLGKVTFLPVILGG